MASLNPSYGIVGADLLPFSIYYPNVEQSFRVEISLLSAQFKIPSLAVESSRPSAAAALRCPPSAGNAATSSSPRQGAPTKRQDNKTVDTSIYALAKLSKTGTVFKSEVQDKAPEAEITVSPEAAVPDEVKWDEQTCVAVFENLKLRKVEQSLGSADACKWQPLDITISVCHAKKTNMKKTTDEKQTFHQPKKLGCVTVNVADFVGSDKPAQQLSSPDGKFSLTFQIKTSALKRSQPTGAPHADSRAVKSRQEILLSAKSQLGNAQTGRELLVKVDPTCTFTEGMDIGIVVEEAWRGKDFMLLHRLSKFEACDPSAVNHFGKIAKLEDKAGFKAMRVQCPVISNTKGGETHQESRFGWRLSTCNGRLGINTQSAPYAALDPHSDVICCVFLSGKAAAADDAAAQQDAGSISREQAEQYQLAQSMKKRALLLSTSPFELTSDELGMVRLRQGFLASQPLISQIVRRLMMLPGWFPGKEDDACIKFFGFKEGPWDIFYVFEFLRQAGNPKNAELNGRKNIFQLLTKVLFHKDADEKHSRLQIVLDQIFDFRNWWAHVGVGSANCSQALRAIVDFINMVVQAPDLSLAGDAQTVSAVLCELESIITDLNSDDYTKVKLTLDDISYIFYLRSSLSLCQLCTKIYSTCPTIQLSKKLKVKLDNKAKMGSRRQSDIIEPLEITSAILNMSADLKFECNFIVKTRNSLAHAPRKGNRVILVLVALGAVSRVLKYLNRCCQTADCGSLGAEALDESTQVQAMQAELLGRSQLLRADAVESLIGMICQSNQNALNQCSFKEYLTSNFRKLQMLLFRSIPGCEKVPQDALPGVAHRDDSPEAEDSMSDDKASRKCLCSLLHLVAQIPLERKKSAKAAIDWIFDTTRPEPGLLCCCGLHVLKNHLDEKNSFMYSQMAATPESLQFCKLLDVLNESKSKLAAALWAFNLALFSDTFRFAEEQFCKDERWESMLDSDVSRWEGRNEFFGHLNHTELADLASNVLEAYKKNIESQSEVDRHSQMTSNASEPAAAQYVIL
jgi:hypothetical protein